jgi:hypothetical protein
MPYDDEQDGTHQNDVDVDVTNDADGNSGGGSDDQGDQPFLVVNDRQQYKTREEAIRAYNEAGTRIAQLSAWEKELERYGVKDPKIASQLFDELLTSRQKLSEFEKANKSSAQNGDAGKGATTSEDDADLSKEDKAALKWLQKHAPRLGFVPKEELQSLKKEFEDFKNSATQNNEAAQERYRSSVIADGKNSVVQLLAADKISDDAEGTKAGIVETLITAWINSNDERVQKFWTGGTVTQALLKEGYEAVKKNLGWSGQANSQQNTALDKGKQLQRNRTLPKTDAAGKNRQQNDGVRKDAAGRKDHIGSVHDKAWEIAEKHFAGRSAA